MPVRQQPCACIMVIFGSEWNDYPIQSVPWLLMCWRNEEQRHQQPQNLPFSPDIFQSQQPLHWRHNERGGVPDHQPRDCLLSRLFGCRSKKTSKLRVTGLCAGISPVTGKFPAQNASNAENVSIWWSHYAKGIFKDFLALLSMWMQMRLSNIMHWDWY